ncbi:MAG TPA: DUF6491 family protein [Arenimonas sp.]|nr:DUF6491 family protein [Arenimonas sp.]
MRHALLLSALIPLAACTTGGQTAGTTHADGGVTHPSECLDPDLARSWQDVDSTTLLVDAGSRKYRVRLAESCFALGTSPDLRFIGGSINGRICGYAGEYVVSGRQRCRIAQVERLDDAAYAKAMAGDEDDEADAGADDAD